MVFKIFGLTLFRYIWFINPESFELNPSWSLLEDIFGSLITNINSDEITCITKEKTRVTYIDYDRITDTENIKYDYYLTFIKNLLIILEEQLTTKNERIAILTKKTTRDKLLQFFKLTSIKKGSRTFTIPYSFTELAGYL